MKQVIILIGSPGAGKGSQAETLKKELRIPHISTGNIIRENIARRTPLGLAFKEYCDAGKMGPDSITIAMVFDRISAPDCDEGYILDGFPRNLTQAVALKDRLGTKVSPISIHLQVPDTHVIERLTGRLTCKGCFAPYHKTYLPPSKPGICDSCGSELLQRADDTLKTVQNRLEVYKTETAPILEFYAKASELHLIDATQNKEAITKELLSLLRGKAKHIPIGV